MEKQVTTSVRICDVKGCENEAGDGYYRLTQVAGSNYEEYRCPIDLCDKHARHFAEYVDEHPEALNLGYDDLFDGFQDYLEDEIEDDDEDEEDDYWDDDWDEMDEEDDYWDEMDEEDYW